MNEGSKILLNDTIEHLYLSICLWMIHKAHPQGSFIESKQLLPEATNEQGIYVQD